MAKNRKNPVIARDGNVNTLNSDMSSEVLYTAPGANMGDQPFLMDVSERGHAEILDELTDLSANKGAYALREVYSNAHDATVRLGDMTRPIEITVPSVAYAENSLAEKLAMTATVSESEIEYAYVTDHGIGMTEYDLRTYFTQYGGSNKRGDAASIGSKGLGSKAPLAVADYFDVVTSKDGVKTSMHLWRAEDGNYAEVTGSEPCPADETGTTVKIPVMNPTVGKQMLECAEEIARYNSDANVIVNGNRTISTLARRVGSVSNIDGCDYVCVGDVTIGVTQDGQAVTVPTWLSTEVFNGRLMPWEDGRSDSRLDAGDAGVRAILCGIGYQLVAMKESNNYYWSRRKPHPTCIIEIEPGYLNFTVSRDEIKDDSRKKAFVQALAEAVDALNLWPVAIRRNAYGFDKLRHLLDGHSLGMVDGSWAITESYADFTAGERYVLTDEDIKLFRDGDGHSMLPLLATFDGCDPDGHQARLLAWFSSARNGKSARFHAALTDRRAEEDIDAGNWDTDLLSWKHGTDPSRGAGGSNSFSPNIDSIHDVVENVLPYAQIASVVREGFGQDWSLMVIGGVTASAFAKAEHSIRRHVAYEMGHSVLQESILYVLCDGPVSDKEGDPNCLSDAELALLGVMGGHVEVAMLDELAKRCAKEDRERTAREGRKQVRKGPKPLGSFSCFAAEIDSDKFADVNELIIATELHDGVPALDRGTLYRSITDLDEIGDTDLVVIGRPTFARCSLIAMQAMLLQKLGRLDAKYDKVVFVPCSHDGNSYNKGEALYAPQVKRLARQSVVLDDLREDWAVESVDGIFKAFPFIVSDGVNIDVAGIAPNDEMTALVATGGRPLGMGGAWFIAHMEGGFDLADRALALAGEHNRFVPSVMTIRTSDKEVTAFKAWMDKVWNVITAYPLSSVLNNVADPDVEGFLKVMMEGVICVATAEYEKEVGHTA